VLRETLEETERQQNGSCAFIIVSVDNLDRVNDAYGFEIADEVVAAIGQRLRAAMRARDSIGRFSGNKFGMILRSCTPEDMAIAADRFCAAVRENAVPTNAGLVAVTTTIGGVTAPRHARTLQEVVTRAQESVYFARAKRLGSFHAYHPSIEREAQRRESVKATDEIVTALNERRIVLAYEPVVETKSRRPGFYECLMRVRCADGGIIAANEIIPVAERLGLVRLIDHRMAELVVAELATIPDLRVSLNVSPASTIDPDWWTSLAAQLRSNPGIGERLTLEITEMAAIQDVEDTRGFVNRVKDLGCRLAIDDFGAGHTSFRNLRRLGVDMIKIDGAFVQNLTRSADDRAFVQAMLSLGRSLGLATVAEWVQDEAAAALLSEWNCDYLQGDLVGHASIERPQTGGAVNGVSSR
jgi:diguanylate cyclase (GGDEF)-like protein